MRKVTKNTSNKIPEEYLRNMKKVTKNTSNKIPEEYLRNMRSNKEHFKRSNRTFNLTQGGSNITFSLEGVDGPTVGWTNGSTDKDNGSYTTFFL